MHGRAEKWCLKPKQSRERVQLVMFPDANRGLSVAYYENPFKPRSVRCQTNTFLYTSATLLAYFLLVPMHLGDSGSSVRDAETWNSGVEHDSADMEISTVAP